MRLAEVVGKVRFPLVSFPARWWSGDMFVGDVRSIRGEILSVQLVYVAAGGASGLLVSHLAPKAASDRADLQRLGEHLSSFVTQFDPSFLVPKAKRGRFVGFPEKDLVQHEEVGLICGTPSALALIEHRRLPLRAVRTALASHGQVVDLCIAGWERGVMDAVPHLESLTADTVQRFDALAHERS